MCPDVFPSGMHGWVAQHVQQLAADIQLTGQQISSRAQHKLVWLASLTRHLAACAPGDAAPQPDAEVSEAHAVLADSAAQLLQTCAAEIKAGRTSDAWPVLSAWQHTLAVLAQARHSPFHRHAASLQACCACLEAVSSSPQRSEEQQAMPDMLRRYFSSIADFFVALPAASSWQALSHRAQMLLVERTSPQQCVGAATAAALQARLAAGSLLASTEQDKLLEEATSRMQRLTTLMQRFGVAACAQHAQQDEAMVAALQQSFNVYAPQDERAPLSKCTACLVQLLQRRMQWPDIVELTKQSALQEALTQQPVLRWLRACAEQKRCG